jgi:hypothetical protein
MTTFSAKGASFGTRTPYRLKDLAFVASFGTRTPYRLKDLAFASLLLADTDETI